MSFADPGRFNFSPSISCRCPSGPNASHCRSVVGFDRTNPRRHAVYRDPPGAEFLRKLPCQSDLRRLGAGISLNASQTDPKARAA